MSSSEEQLQYGSSSSPRFIVNHNTQTDHHHHQYGSSPSSPPTSSSSSFLSSSPPPHLLNATTTATTASTTIGGGSSETEAALLARARKKSITLQRPYISVDVYFNQSGDHCLLDALNPSLTFQQLFQILVQKRALNFVMDQLAGTTSSQHQLQLQQQSSNSSSFSNSSTSGTGGSSNALKAPQQYTLNLLMTSTDSKKMKTSPFTSQSYIPVKMEDNLGASTYSPFCRPTLVLHLQPPIPHERFTKVFGNHLIVTSRNPAQTEIDIYKQPIPRFLKLCFSFLSKTGTTTTGIFRVSGSLKEVEAMRKRVDEGTFMPIKPSVDPNSISGLVKMYLRELPEPLLTFNLYDSFKELFVNEKLSENDRIVKCRQLIHGLPSEHYAVLEHLMAILNLMIIDVEQTKMTPETLSIVIGPNIMVPPQLPGDHPEDHSTTLQDTPIICNVASLMIQNYSQLFRHASPYDSNLKGLDDLSPEDIVQGGTPQAKKVSTIKGHLPRAVFHYNNEELPNDVYYELRNVRLIGESLVLLNRYTDAEDSSQADSLYVERELPLDHIVEVVDLVDATPSALQIKYLFKKENYQVYIVNDYDQHEPVGFTGFVALNSSVATFYGLLCTVMKRYSQYVELANTDPEKYGTVITKEELRLAKKRKQERQNREMEASVDITTPQSPSGEHNADDEFDSDSDDSVTFRED